MNYYTAKRLWHTLGVSLQRHEQAFGVLEADIDKRIIPQSRTQRKKTIHTSPKYGQFELDTFSRRFLPCGFQLPSDTRTRGSIGRTGDVAFTSIDSTNCAPRQRGFYLTQDETRHRSVELTRYSRFCPGSSWGARIVCYRLSNVHFAARTCRRSTCGLLSVDI